MNIEIRILYTWLLCEEKRWTVDKMLAIRTKYLAVNVGEYEIHKALDIIKAYKNNGRPNISTL